MSSSGLDIVLCVKVNNNNIVHIKIEKTQRNNKTLYFLSQKEEEKDFNSIGELIEFHCLNPLYISNTTRNGNDNFSLNKLNLGIPNLHAVKNLNLRSNDPISFDTIKQITNAST
eukprot:Pgem_evm1s9834